MGRMMSTAVEISSQQKYKEFWMAQEESDLF